MKIFFDTEFTGLHKNTTLISIGLVSEDNRQFYAEFTDYDEEQCNDWIRKNVLDNTLMKNWKKRGEKYIENYYLGTKYEIGKMLENWLAQFNEVEFISDVCHYDMVLLLDIFGGAFSLPKQCSPSCYDINQDIARFYNISQKEAFDKSREEIIKGIDIGGEKHNALYDAKVIKAIYEKFKIYKKMN